MQNKKIMLLLIISGILMLNACMQDTSVKFTEEDETLIRETADKAMQLYNETGDVSEYANLYYSDNAVVLASNTDPIEGKEAIVEFLGMFPDMDMEFKIVELYGAEDMAYVYGWYNLDFGEDMPGDKGKYIEIWRRQEDGSWRITHDIFNTNLPFTELENEEDED